MMTTLPATLDQTPTEVVILDLIPTEAEILATLVTVDMEVELPVVITMGAVETATRTTTKCSFCMNSMIL